MSRKYFDKLIVGDGTSQKKVKSKFGEMMMAKLGWSEGKGLGRNEDGMKEVIQVKRREVGSGLGA